MPDHFIETNIIIGYTVDWDQQAPVVKQYLDSITRIDIHTSPRVLTEAEDVVNDRRRLTKQAARLIFQDFDTGRRQPPIQQIVDFVWRELSHYRDSVVSHVVQHIRDHEQYYIGLTQVDTRTVLERTTDDIDDDFDAVISIITSIRNHNCDGLNCSVFANIKQDYSTLSVFGTVDSILSGKSNDRDILLDSYHLTQEESLNPLYFVTMDGDFLDNESRLESCLGSVDIEHPTTV
ncbi:hypothetical protein [Salinigranum marinum]|uniref:hypothetical protein n=1 Tax=Salinigranum marinum TaxID=1515595 RepID=UPI002989C015|nr:hypothetical protein [Salinigranum marinum]